MVSFTNQHMTPNPPRHRVSRKVFVTKEKSTDIHQGFELLGIHNKTRQEYPGGQNFAKQFVRCSRTKFTQVTYSANSN
jgi:hypothetical protein